MRRRRALVAACVAALAASCAAPAPERDELAEALVRSGLSDGVADCVADALVDNLTEDQLAELTLRGPGAAPVDDPDRADDRADALRLAMDACRVLQAEAAPSTTSTTVAASPSGVGTTGGEELRPVPPGGTDPESEG
jgi:hypothetical protein